MTFSGVLCEHSQVKKETRRLLAASSNSAVYVYPTVLYLLFFSFPHETLYQQTHLSPFLRFVDLSSLKSEKRLHHEKLRRSREGEGNTHTVLRPADPHFCELRFFHTLLSVEAQGAGVVSTLAKGFNYPFGIAALPNGDIVVADGGHHAIQYVTMPTGVVTTLAGGFNNPYGIAAFGRYLQPRHSLRY